MAFHPRFPLQYETTLGSRSVILHIRFCVLEGQVVLEVVACVISDYVSSWF